MSSRINNFQDILEALERDPALREQLRRHILNEEILNLPARMEVLLTRIGDLGPDGQTLNARVQYIEGQVRRIGRRVGHIERGIYEDKVLQPAIPRSMCLGLERPRLAFARKGMAPGQFHESMSNAVAAGRITTTQYAELAQAALIIQGANQLHAVFEVSINPGDGDITRALERAEILRQATGDNVIPAVITHEPSLEFASEAAIRGVQVLDIAG